MNREYFEIKVNTLLGELKDYIESGDLCEGDVSILKEEIDKLLYECLYYKSRLLC